MQVFLSLICVFSNYFRPTLYLTYRSVLRVSCPYFWAWLPHPWCAPSPVRIYSVRDQRSLWPPSELTPELWRGPQWPAVSSPSWGFHHGGWRCPAAATGGKTHVVGGNQWSWLIDSSIEKEPIWSPAYEPWRAAPGCSPGSWSSVCGRRFPRNSVSPSCSVAHILLVFSPLFFI